MSEMQFKSSEEEILRIQLCRHGKTSGWDSSISRVLFLQQNLLQHLPLKTIYGSQYLNIYSGWRKGFSL
jgi:hypothetical protein